MIQERYLYHNFPRRGAGSATEINKGLAILSCIRDLGLLLVPEAIEWSQPVTNGPPRAFPVLQSRVCFTDLSPAELSQHGERFGHFALEFDVESVRRLGAMPVFYIPQREGGVGTSLLALIADARYVVNRAAQLDNILRTYADSGQSIKLQTGFARNPGAERTFLIRNNEINTYLEALNYLNHLITPWQMLSIGMDAALNFFYPADNVIHDKPLQYYQQREWRIACNFAINGVYVLREPTPEEKTRITEIDPAFFSRVIQTDLGQFATLDKSLIHPGLNGRTILQLARRVIVPESALEESRSLLSIMKDVSEIVSIESLA